MSRTQSLLAALGLGLVAAVTVSELARSDFDLVAGEHFFRRLVAGATPNGTVHERAVVVLVGLDRSTHREVLIRVGPSRSIGVAVDRGEIAWMRTSPEGVVALGVDPEGSPGVRLDFVPAPDQGPIRLESIRVADRGRAPLARALAAGVATALLAFGVSRRKGARVGAALGLVSAGSWALAWTPASTVLGFPDAGALLRLTPIAVFFGLGFLLGLRRESERPYFGRASLLVAALVFGLFIRVSFLASSGSWDTDIWKAWMLRSVSHGLTHAYGDPGAVPAGQFWLQIRGEEIPWKIPHAGRLFVIDYPPLAILLWHSSFWVVTHVAPALDFGEAQNVAVKLPAVVGDVLALFLLLWALRDSPDRGLTMAALYWCLPIAWYSSAVLGFLDGAFAPVALAALVAGARARPWLAGLLMSVAFWIKPLAVIVAPALLVALLTPGSIDRGLRVIGRVAMPALFVSAVVCLPYWLADTLETMFVHLARLFAAGNLSSGFPNPWWIAGQWLSVTRGEASFEGPVAIVTLSSIGFPISIVGTLLVAVTTASACFFQYRSAARHAVFLSAATAYFSYSIFGMGVFENHPHFVFLLLIATGLATQRLKLIFSLTAAVYVLNLFFLTGLGRFYGLRYWILEGVSTWHVPARMALGFDVTLVLAVLNIAAFTLWLFWLSREMGLGGSKSVR